MPPKIDRTYTKKRRRYVNRPRKSSAAAQSKSEPMDTDVFVVEKIIGKRTLNGRVEYLIKWQGE